ncbi:S8 family serine peptidase [Dactylosporangium sp. McL0621]|uniref:S8 family serine peptidase n=1 Tax=Dactylosporangium sp. McL0621 TaxID=3415678 RepID=UPI003CEAED10
MAPPNQVLHKLDGDLAFRIADRAESGHPADRATVLVHVVGDLATVEAAGLWTEWTIGPISRGTVAYGDLEALAALPDVERIEVPRRSRKLLHENVPEMRGDRAREVPPGFSGKGVVVGVVDPDMVDIFHHTFRKPDDTTRFLAYFDQTVHHQFVVTGPVTGGTFTVTFIGPAASGAGRVAETTDPISIPTTAAAFQAALEKLNGINPGDIAVTGGPLPGTPLVVDFIGRYDPAVFDGGRLVLLLEQVTLIPGHDPAQTMVKTSGRAFTADELNAVLAQKNDKFVSLHPAEHATHVLGIAAGNGSQAGTTPGGDCCRRAGYYVGVAPDADLVMVRTTGFIDDLARGARFVLEQPWLPAGATRQPAVVNISNGSELSAHDGTDAVEKAIDALVEAAAGRAVVVAAGNDGQLFADNLPAERLPKTGGAIHSTKDVPAHGTQAFHFTIRGQDLEPDLFELWYPGPGSLNISFTAPGNAPSTPVPPKSGAVRLSYAGHTLRVLSTVGEPQNGRNRITATIVPPDGQPIAPGTWTLRLIETAGTIATAHCWISSTEGDPHPRWVRADQEQSVTVNAPANAKNVITVGAYNIADGQLADFSARGPTLDNRMKPDLAAPGVGVVSAKSVVRPGWLTCDCCADFYLPELGTSTAAPFVAGTVALMFQANPALTFGQVRDILHATARKPSPDPGVPDNAWGYGKLDAEQAVRRALPAAPAGTPVTVSASARASTFLPPAEKLEALRQRVEASATGRLLLALASEHIDEVRRLVNTDRHSLIAWHRMHGPAILRSALATFADEVPIPADHGDRPIADGLGRLLDALADAGSPALRRAIQDHRPLLLAVPGARLTDLDLLEVH